MQILVMGGNQFLGKTLVEKLLKQNHKVFVLNRGNRENPVGTIHLKADRNNISEIKEILNSLKFDIIIDVSAYTAEQVKNLYSNLKGKFKQYILISSASIYNSIEDFPVNEKSKVGENINWGDYSKNKYLAEKEVEKMEENFTILRPFYIYGIGNNLDREQYIFSRLENNLPIYLPNDGKNKLQFGYIDDLVNLIIFSFQNSDFYRQIFNVTGDEIINIEDFVLTCAEIIGKKADIKYIKCDESVKARDWFPFRALDLYGQIEKLKNTGFYNSYTLKKGLEKTYKYLKENNLLRYPNLTNLELSWNK
ncbi:MAG: SDR family oxidoreductase [Fusobacterium sp.]|nr:SDR family oxidoreductase [Fusobacterium sp.]